MENCQNPLVSILIVTFNAEAYICETLESVKSQTYRNIELIISDDCSSDKTVELCKQWLNSNADCFRRTVIVESSTNSGVSANYNRGVRECKGKWIKNVDGDDLLLPNCIEDNIQFVQSEPKAKVVFSNVIIMYDNKIDGCKDVRFFSDKTKQIFKKNSLEQYLQLLHFNFLPSQSAFIETKLLLSHPYNERYKGLEDYPMWFTLLKEGNQFYYFDVDTAKYRVGESITKSRNRFFSPIYMESMMLFSWLELFPEMKKYSLTNAYIDRRRFLLKFELYEILFNNKMTPINLFLSRIVNFFVNKIKSFN